MFSSNVSRNFVHQPGCRSYKLKSYFAVNLLQKRTTFIYYTCNKRFISSLFLKPLCRSFCIKEEYLTSKRFIKQDSVNGNNGILKTYFQQLMYDRKKQAERSVLLLISNKADVPYALALCEKHGSIVSAHLHSIESDNHFLLLEFSDEASVNNLLSQCKYKADTFTMFSRIIQFKKKQGVNPSTVNTHVIEDSASNFTLKRGSSISDLIEKIYLNEKLPELDTRIRYFFCTLTRDSISNQFPHCDVLPFGSSVNGIGKSGCDLDVMICLYPEQANEKDGLFFLHKTQVANEKVLQSRSLLFIDNFIRNAIPGVQDGSIERILKARIPILKFKHKIFKLDCDISVNNRSAILMSEIIHFCGEIDSRVRPLLYAVKKWAKESSITHDTAGSQISNFGLVILALFFLQNRPDPILPFFNDALIIIGEEGCSDFRLQYLKSIEELKTRASLNEESLAVLLKEFLMFLGKYSEDCISLMSGKNVPRKDGSILSIQYPFAEHLNITRNVSENEFRSMRSKAKQSAQYLENNLNIKVNHFKDFGTCLGVVANSEKKKPPKRDVNTFYEDYNKNSKIKAARHKHAF